MGLFSRSKTSKPRALAFVDYEHWFYSYKNLFSMTPDLEAWRDELQEYFELEDILVFANFSVNYIAPEWEKLEKLGARVIHTGIAQESSDKDYTDFIMLDHIYQAATRKDIEVYVIFTGDGHFGSAVRYIRNKLNKRVIVYGVNRALSGRLKSEASSYVEMPRYEQEQQFYIDLVLNTLERLTLQKKDPTYRRTIDGVAKSSRVARDRIKWAMDYLMEKGYVSERKVKVRTSTGGKNSAKDGGKAGADDAGKKQNAEQAVKVLSVDWNAIKKDGIWGKLK
ncbi:MAG: NYN domain-containing protein [Lachnospiraceae bacterium]|nr:NYN domain-containing protein [Lachnospiraceae bacterium]